MLCMHAVVCFFCLASCHFISHRYEGVRGFYKGGVIYMWHVTPNICIVFLMYEYITNLKRESGGLKNWNMDK